MSIELMGRIAEWKLEAKRETSIDFYVPFKLVDRVIDGRRSLVIGRRGTGKTAIAKYIQSTQKSYLFGFDLFQFQNITDLRDNGINKHYDYINIWLYIIYMSAIEIAYREKTLHFDLRDRFAPLFESIEISDLNSKIRKWTKFDLSLSFMGLELKGKTDGSVETKKENMRDNVKMLEKIISETKFDNYFILFDEIDEEISSNSEDRQTQLKLIVSLIKALDQIRYHFTGKIKPILFLREDTYSIIKHDDKTKWIDIIYKPSWDHQLINQLIRKRISSEAASINLGDNGAYLGVFSTDTFKNNNKKRYNTLEYIGLHTQIRPRDYISFVRLCANYAFEHGHTMISTATIENCHLEYSNWLKEDLMIELKTLFADSEILFETISRIKKPKFYASEYLSIYREIANTGIDDAARTLKSLYQFGALGNNVSHTKELFIFTDSNTTANISQPFVVHRGLFKSLQLYH